MLVYKRTDATLERWGAILVEKLKAQLRIGKHIATRRTEESIKHEIGVEGDIRGLKILARSSRLPDGTILDVLDQGQMPHPTSGWPVSAIEGWMKAKNIQPRRNRKFVSRTDTNIKRAAYAIARAIREKGTIKQYGYRGANLYELAFGSQANAMGQDLADAYAADVNEYLDEKTNAK